MENQLAVYEAMPLSAPQIQAQVMIGKVFGQLTVISFAFTNKHRSKCYFCKCSCGSEKVINGAELRNGRTVSCGCYNRTITRNSFSGTGNNQYKHGGRHTKLYRIWRGMKERCYDTHHISFNYYGAKGIEVCESWLNNFNSFREWAIKAGYKEGLSIDRKQSTLNYAPENCSWVTRSENTARGNKERTGK